MEGAFGIGNVFLLYRKGTFGVASFKRYAVNRNYLLFDKGNPAEAVINPLSQEGSNQSSQSNTGVVGSSGLDGVRASDSESIETPEPTINVDVELQETALPGAVEKVSENPAREDMERLTVHVSTKLIDRIRGAVAQTPGMTLSRLATESFSVRLAEMEAERGAPFKPRTTRLKGGRPRRESPLSTAQ